MRKTLAVLALIFAACTTTPEPTSPPTAEEQAIAQEILDATGFTETGCLTETVIDPDTGKPQTVCAGVICRTLNDCAIWCGRNFACHQKESQNGKCVSGSDIP